MIGDKCDGAIVQSTDWMAYKGSNSINPGDLLFQRGPPLLSDSNRFATSFDFTQKKSVFFNKAFSVTLATVQQTGGLLTAYYNVVSAAQDFETKCVLRCFFSSSFPRFLRHLIGKYHLFSFLTFDTSCSAPWLPKKSRRTSRWDQQQPSMNLSLQLADMAGIFVLYGIGLACSIAIFYLQICCKRHVRPRTRRLEEGVAMRVDAATGSINAASASVLASLPAVTGRQPSADNFGPRTLEDEQSCAEREGREEALWRSPFAKATEARPNYTVNSPVAF
jgi:hypothetical protein